MKQILTLLTAGLLLFLVLVATPSFAQDTKKDKAAKALTDTMRTQLSLDDTQYSKVYDINADFMDKLAGVKGDGDSKMAKFKKLKAIDEDRDKALKTVLSAEQFKSFQEFKKQNRQEMKARFKARSK
ncbi:hypothetical protein [Chitinophaga pinensis]|uniref:DUF4890 domain-containing protein n=1 Tax=Chitinophaga pinensis TaxID=79329 RepID=A0A5C6LS49_9BACT|nr:hypothetical protein [Chitinophaga pinensis]TWV98011.1 hypothetical protein FEF09_20800 [Chitinophaga pinensis]